MIADLIINSWLKNPPIEADTVYFCKFVACVNISAPDRIGSVGRFGRGPIRGISVEQTEGIGGHADTERRQTETDGRQSERARVNRRRNDDDSDDAGQGTFSERRRDGRAARYQSPIEEEEEEAVGGQIARTFGKKAKITIGDRRLEIYLDFKIV